MYIMKVAIVTTTINPPDFLLNYFNNFVKWIDKNNYSRDDILFIVVGDNKTPHKLYSKKSRVYDFPVEYWNPVDQDIWLLKHYNNLHRDLIPENNPRRRNFGYLRAIELNADYIITIDDDNVPKDTNWLQEHLAPLQGKKLPIVYSRNKCINPCKALSHNRIIVYARGFPINRMLSDSFIIENKIDNRKIVLNEGLWTESPDVDAFTNIIYNSLTSYGTSEEGFIVEKDNYIPINTQNTAFTKEIAPIFWNIYMNSIYDLPLERYCDIWGGLFAQKVINHLNGAVSFGKPIVSHKRNVHNYGRDLRVEWMGILLNPRIWDFVTNLKLHSGSYISSYLEIADEIEFELRFSDDIVNKFKKHLADAMRTWIELTEKLI